jgi:hypothetical protein
VGPPSATRLLRSGEAAGFLTVPGYLLTRVAEVVPSL